MQATVPVTSLACCSIEAPRLGERVRGIFKMWLCEGRRLLPPELAVALPRQLCRSSPCWNHLWLRPKWQSDVTVAHEVTGRRPEQRLDFHRSSDCQHASLHSGWRQESGAHGGAGRDLCGRRRVGAGATWTEREFTACSDSSANPIGAEVQAAPAVQVLAMKDSGRFRAGGDIEQLQGRALTIR